MEKIIRIGMDTSKSVFQLHGVDAAEQPVLRKKLRRRQVLAFFARLAPTEDRAWRPAARRITGRASVRRWATRWCCCRRNT